MKLSIQILFLLSICVIYQALGQNIVSNEDTFNFQQNIDKNNLDQEYIQMIQELETSEFQKQNEFLQNKKTLEIQQYFRKLDEYDDLNDQTSDPDIINLGDYLDQNITIKQNFQNKFFTLNIPDTSKYATVEIWIDNQKSHKGTYQGIPMVFAAGYEENKDPRILFDEKGAHLNFTQAFDRNGYYQEKSYRRIFISPKDNQNADKEVSNLVWKFLSFISKDSVYQYHLKASIKDDPTCPNNCSGNGGTCIKDSEFQQGICQCFESKIDEDCSVSAVKLEKDIQNTSSILLTSIIYFIFTLPQDSSYREDDLALNIIKNNDQDIIMYSTFYSENFNSYLPTERAFTYQTVINKQETRLLLKNSDLKSKSTSYPIIFGFKSLSQFSSVIEVSIEAAKVAPIDEGMDSNMMIVYFLLAIAGILFIVWIVLTIIRIKFGSQQNQQNILPIAFVRRRRPQQNNSLTKEMIEKYMPSKQFSVIKEEQAKKISDEENCSVCLIEFEAADLVRQTICSHFFHPECLEGWLAKQENCPLCREELTRKKLDEHLKSKGQRLEVPEGEQHPDEEGGEQEEDSDETNDNQQQQNNNNNQAQFQQQQPQQVNDQIQVVQNQTSQRSNRQQQQSQQQPQLSSQRQQQQNNSQRQQNNNTNNNNQILSAQGIGSDGEANQSNTQLNVQQERPNNNQNRRPQRNVSRAGGSRVSQITGANQSQSQFFNSSQQQQQPQQQQPQQQQQQNNQEQEVVEQIDN